MPKHHQSKAEQIANRTQDAAQFQQDKMHYQKNPSMKLEDMQKKGTVDDHSIQIRAYQIYRDKGGSALDNWLEAERILKDNDQAVLIL